MGTERHTRTHRGVEYTVSPAHPAAGAFPWLPEAELQALADDIAANGQQYKIVRLPDGRVVDGRNRELACLVAGEEPQYADQDMGEDDVVRLVLSRNVHRRHLDASQRAMAAAELANLSRGRPEINPSQDGLNGEVNISQAVAATQLDVSAKSVERAAAVKKKAPELVEAVKEGKLDVRTAAKVADLPKRKREKVAQADDPKAAAKEELGRVAAKVVMPAETDAWGIPVQPHAAEAFAAVPKFRELLAAIQAAARLFNEVANLPGGKFLTLPDVSSYRRGKRLEDGTHADRFVHEGLERAAQQVKNATPAHTVCPWHYADAPHPAECATCRGLNWTPPLSANVPPVCVERAKAAHGVAGEESA